MRRVLFLARRAGDARKLLMKTVLFKCLQLGTSGTVAVMLLTGCGSSAPEAPTPDQLQQATQSQIQSIQNNPNMPPEAKQRAIEGIRSQQKRGTP